LIHEASKRNTLMEDKVDPIEPTQSQISIETYGKPSTEGNMNSCGYY